MSTTAASKFPSSAFIEDALFFVVSIIPLVYFFGENWLLLASVSHALSIPCAGIAHSPTIDKLQAFFLSLVSGLLLLVDAVTVVLCVCQITQAKVCCDVLSSVGAVCMNHVEDFPVTVAMLPVGLYNLVRGLERIVKLWRASVPRGRRGFVTALLISALSGYIALIVQRGKRDAVVDVLALIVLYTLAMSCIGAADLYYGSSALVAVFFSSHGLVAYQSYLSLSERMPNMFAGVAVVVFVAASFVTMPLSSTSDTWTSLYSMLAGVAALTATIAVWQDLNPLAGSILIGYFTTCVGRSFLFRSDSMYVGLISSVVFCAADVATTVLVLVYHPFTFVILCTIGFVTGSSFVVSMYTLITRVGEIEQARLCGEQLFPSYKDVQGAGNKQEYDSGGDDSIQVGKEVAQSIMKIVKTDGFAVETAFGEISDIIHKKGAQWSDPGTPASTRSRMKFFHALQSGLGSYLAEDVMREVLQHRLLIVGVPISTMTKQLTETGKYATSLDVVWTPGTDLDIVSLLKLCLSHNSIENGQRIHEEIRKRYMFKQMFFSFNTASSNTEQQHKFETLWRIVWHGHDKRENYK